MRACVDLLWKRHLRQFNWQTALYCFWISGFTLFSDVLASDGVEMFDGLSRVRDSTRYLIVYLSFPTTAFGAWYFLVREIRERVLYRYYAIRKRSIDRESNVGVWTRYFRDFNETSVFNLMQALTLSLIGIVLVLSASLTWNGRSVTKQVNVMNASQINASTTDLIGDGMPSRNFVANENVLEWLETCTSLSSVLMWLGLLHYARGRSGTGPMIGMVLRVASDSIPFFLIVIVPVIGFGVSFRVLFSRHTRAFQTCSLNHEHVTAGLCDHAQTGYGSLFDAIYSTFVTGFLGWVIRSVRFASVRFASLRFAFQPLPCVFVVCDSRSSFVHCCREPDFVGESLEEYALVFGSEPFIIKLLFCLFLALICVIALNSLIANMSESLSQIREVGFSTVDEYRKAELTRQRANLLIELILLGTSHNTLSEDEHYNAWVHCLIPKLRAGHAVEDESAKRSQRRSRLLSQAQLTRHTVEDKSAKRSDLMTRSPFSEGVQRMEMEEAKLNAIQQEFVNQEERLTKLMDEKLSKSEGKIEALLSSSQEKIDGKLSSLLLSSRESQMLPQDVRHLLGSIQENHETGRVKEAQASFRTLVEW